MTNSIYFINPGEIDIDAALTMGVNAKLTDSNPIGYFGTGLKYAIAVLLRNSHTIQIASGLNIYEFTAEPKQSRGIDYELVLCNGLKTGFTTNLGKNWELWMAYRELFCNAKDEKGIATDSTITPKQNYTVIKVTGKAFSQIHTQKSDFFLEKKPIFSTSQCEIHQKTSAAGGRIFYKGILVRKNYQNQNYDYNILENMTLTEDRTLLSMYDAYIYIAKAIAESNRADIVQATALNKNADEHRSGMWSCVYNVSPTFASMLDACRDTLPSDLASLRAAYCIKKPSNQEKTNLSFYEKCVLEEAKNILTKIGFEITHPIVVSDDLGANILGKAANETIYLSEVLLTQGSIRVASTILEEEIHLTKGLRDCTYEMQTYLFDLLISNSLSLLNKKEN